MCQQRGGICASTVSGRAQIPTEERVNTKQAVMLHISMQKAVAKGLSFSPTVDLTHFEPHHFQDSLQSPRLLVFGLSAQTVATTQTSFKEQLGCLRKLTFLPHFTSSPLYRSPCLLS